MPPLSKPIKDSFKYQQSHDESGVRRISRADAKALERIDGDLPSGESEVLDPSDLEELQTEIDTLLIHGLRAEGPPPLPRKRAMRAVEAQRDRSERWIDFDDVVAGAGSCCWGGDQDIPPAPGIPVLVIPREEELLDPSRPLFILAVCCLASVASVLAVL